MIRTYFDSMFITAFEEKTDVDTFVWRVLKAVEAGSLSAVTSQITLTEVLPKPFALEQLDLVPVYEDLLTKQGLVEVLPLTPEILSLASRIRADRLSIKPPDAIHLASARLSACRAILKADKRLASPIGPPIISPGPHSLEELYALSF